MPFCFFIFFPFFFFSFSSPLVTLQESHLQSSFMVGVTSFTGPVLDGNCMRNEAALHTGGAVAESPVKQLVLILHPSAGELVQLPETV